MTSTPVSAPIPASAPDPDAPAADAPAVRSAEPRAQAVDTIAVHAGGTAESNDFTGVSRPVAVPIHQASTFTFDDADVFADAMGKPDAPFVYSRYGNPTTHALETAMAALEGGVAALATSSGMGAITAVLTTHLASGDHVVAQRRLYGGTFAMLRDLEQRYGVQVTYVSGDDPAEVAAAVRPNTRLLYLETIANPMTQVCDIPAMTAVARAHGILTVVDNTFATPVLCRPLAHGADIVVHSTTKYVGGHSDVVGGIAVFADPAGHRAVWDRIVESGVNPDPFAAWLTLRGLRTLPLRMRRHCEVAAVVAGRLAEHPAVSAVYWPGLPDHPRRDVVDRVLDGPGGMLAFDLAGGRAAADAFVHGVRLALLAASLGGLETLVVHPAGTSHRQLDAEQLRAVGIGEGTVRVSVGIEDPEDIWADFAQALPAGS
ncbi:aminotransferase class I/II-fold pyridoxal phosphate-dependent enzyme [Embleya sp. NBC_00896]|uniref:trans-sulfuration enzyme family protein n=1 Tax=Embleya sp. NBC_00896 TaxID=2975961 RepID=UPI002F90CE93|nr:aminotransferase class I/II-fold pyridoxal phosphate-dependent enzyme [Embleya sp. NBC_00896]